jgi:DNA repair protein RAD5
MNAKQSSILTQEHKHAGTLNVEKIQEHFGNEGWTGYKSTSSIHQSLFGSTSDDEDDSNDSNISDKRLNTLYEKAQILDLNIPEAEPPSHTFLYDLRRYQKQALHWMLSKETLDPNETKPTSLHPLWEEYEFPSNYDDTEEDAHPNKFFYFNPYTGIVLRMINYVSIKST